MDVGELDSEEWRNYVIPPQNFHPAEIEVRQRFVAEYVIDHDGRLAALRIGFNANFAVDYAKKFLSEPYVQQLIKAHLYAVENDPEFNKKRVMAALFKEANNHGPGSSHSARVSALAKLTSVLGMDAPAKSESKVTNTHQTVQFYLPENGR